jgi:hypothetical protein
MAAFDPQPIYIDELSEPTEWAVDQRIPEDGVTCFLGKPGGGKTFSAIDAACCMATGLNCWGQQVGPPRTVIYIAAEAGSGVRLRIKAWIIAHRDALKAAERALLRRTGRRSAGLEAALQLNATHRSGLCGAVLSIPYSRKSIEWHQTAWGERLLNAARAALTPPSREGKIRPEACLLSTRRSYVTVNVPSGSTISK